MPRNRVARAFRHRGALPAPQDVGMIQPNPYSPLSRWWALSGIAFLILLLLRIFFEAHHDDRRVLQEVFGPVPQVARGDQGIHLSEEFELEADPGNVRVTLKVPGLVNGWVGVGTIACSVT